MVDGQMGFRFRRQPLVAHLDACEGRTLGELDAAHVFAKTAGAPKITGIAGNVIEQSVLHLAPNSRQEPDIEVDGVRYEVKTTGIRRSARKGGGYEAKEPMSITAVSPSAIVKEDYCSSAFLHKVAHMVLFYYLYDSPKTVRAADYAGFPLLSYQFHEYGDFTEEERGMLESDWLRVRNFIIYLQTNYPDYKTQYPRLSHELRRVLMLLDTAPKWPHPPRFRFKRTFVTCIYRRHVEKRKSLERLPDAYTSHRDLDDKLAALLKTYRGRTVAWLCDHFKITAKKGLKSIAEPVIVRMFGGMKRRMRDVEFFSKLGIVGKSIVLTKNGERTEDTKFFTIDFSEFSDANLAFEDSQFYGYFSGHNILFVVFEEPSAAAPLPDNRFVGLALVSFSEEFIQRHVRPVWERIRHLVQQRELTSTPVVSQKTGRPLVNANGEIRMAVNLPKSRDGLVFVRGTGADSRDKPLCINGVKMYRQQVWVKGAYLARMLTADTLIR